MAEPEAAEPAPNVAGDVTPEAAAEVTQPEQQIEPADPAAPVDDDEFDQEEVDLSSNASTSVKSSILMHSYENGRRYHRYRNGRYPIPNDDEEQNRDDMKHAMMLELTDGKLFFAPIGDYPQKILDLGTGTGIWAIDVADQFPGAEVLGIDLSPIQPQWIPPNLKFLVDDIEDEWANGDSWDLVHMRCITPWLKNPSKLLKTVFDNLKPGGWIEIQEFDGYVSSDDGTVGPDSPLKVFYDTMNRALTNFGMTFRVAETLKELLEAAGFVNVSCQILKAPVGTWARDKRLRLVGLYLQHVTSDLLTAMAAKPLHTLKDLNEVEIQLMLTKAKKDIVDPNTHGYLKYMFWTGQRPN